MITSLGLQAATAVLLVVTTPALLRIAVKEWAGLREMVRNLSEQIHLKSSRTQLRLNQERNYFL